MYYQWSHAARLGLVAPSPGDLAADLVVQAEDVIDGGLVLDHAAGHVVRQGLQVVGAAGT